MNIQNIMIKQHRVGGDSRNQVIGSNITLIRMIYELGFIGGEMKVRAEKFLIVEIKRTL